MRKHKSDRERLEGLMAEINAAYDNGYEGEMCLSPLVGTPLDETENGFTSEGDENDELLT
jgi:hypothetical protein